MKSTSPSEATAKLTQISVAPATNSIPKGTKLQLSAKGIFSDGTQRDLSSSVTWKTSPSTIAIISAQGSVTGVAEGVAQVSADYQGLSGDATITVGSPALNGITVSLPQPSLPMGESEAVVATGSFSDGSTQNLTQLVNWHASPLSVAAITPQGSLTGVGKGVAQISAFYQGLSGGATVAVSPAMLVGIAVSLPQPALPLGASEPVVATGIFSDGTTQNLSQLVVWSSSASAIASVEAGGAVVGKALGSATLSAGSGSLIGSANLNVTAAVAVSLNVTPATSTILIGKSAQFQAVENFSDGTTRDITGTATWSSEQPAIIAVSGGVANADQVGTATITATNSNLSGSATVTVLPLITVSYFNRANLVTSGSDATLRLVNPGLSEADLCAMIYVFDRNQELNECCGCRISKDGERTFSLLNDLTANPLTGTFPVAGSIHVVPSDPDPTGVCNAGSLVPDGTLAGWEINVQTKTGAFRTEIRTANAALADVEAQVLATQCAMLQRLGSGDGKCACGTGD